MRETLLRSIRPAAITLALAATAVMIAFAETDNRRVNTDGSGVAMHGFDPVAYFLEGEPRRGLAAFTAHWQGAAWRFASPGNRDRFESDPERYAPRYGGFCAWAVSRGERADVDPEHAWSIVGDRLYLNYSARIRKRWERDVEDRIVEADRRWPELRGDPAR